MAKTLEKVHTHTQGNLINKKETSMKNALFKIYITDRLLI